VKPTYRRTAYLIYPKTSDNMIFFSHEDNHQDFPEANKSMKFLEGSPNANLSYVTEVDADAMAVKAMAFIHNLQEAVAKWFVDGNATVYIFVERVQTDCWKVHAMSFDRSIIDKMVTQVVDTCRAFKLSSNVAIIERVIGQSDSLLVSKYDSVFVF
jgi:hypothetical protein